MESVPVHKEGLRERKRRQTLQRVAAAGLKLFAKRGYDETTLEAIAEEADISARTFFYYFESKEEILHFWQANGFHEALGPTVRAQSTRQPPLQTMCDCLLELVARYETEQTVVVDRIFNSTETLRARKHNLYLHMEVTVFEALCALWPQPRRRAALRTTAMLAIGALRLAMEAHRRDREPRTLTQCLRDEFALLKRQVRPRASMGSKSGATDKTR